MKNMLKALVVLVVLFTFPICVNAETKVVKGTEKKVDEIHLPKNKYQLRKVNSFVRTKFVAKQYTYAMLEMDTVDGNVYKIKATQK